jgi:hypothetical membrane protein
MTTAASVTKIPHDQKTTTDRAARRFAAACGLVAAIGSAALWIAAGLWERDYDNLRQDISDFGALTATHPAPYNTGVAVSGVLLVVLAIGVYASVGRGRLARAGGAAFILFGACQFLDGVFREDCSPSGDAACRAALDAGNLSWHHQAHDIESLFWFGSVLASMALLGLAFRRLAAWRWLAWPSLGLAAVAGVAVAWYFALYVASDGSAYSGVLERVAAAAAIGWAGLLAVQLWRSSGSTAPTAT